MKEVTFSYIKEVEALVKADIVTPDCVAYHGTSLETILRLARLGTIPGAKVSDPNQSLSQKGDVYFLPNPETFPFELVPDIQEGADTSTSQAIEHITRLASSRAPSHFFLDRLGFDIGHYGHEARVLIQEYPNKMPDGKNWWEKEFQLFKSLGAEDSRIIEAILESRGKSGVVIGLSRTALEIYPSTPGDYGTDFRLSTGVGLSYVYMSGIRIVGIQEQKIFRNLVHKFQI